MRHLIIWPLLVAVALITGCSTLAMPGSNAWSYNPQNYQGCVQAVYEVEDEMITYTDCKDKTNVAAMVDLNSDGKPDMTYDAKDVVGSDAAKIRADVEKVFSDNGMEVAPDVVNGIVDTVLGL